MNLSPKKRASLVVFLLGLAALSLAYAVPGPISGPLAAPFVAPLIAIGIGLTIAGVILMVKFWRS